MSGISIDPAIITIVKAEVKEITDQVIAMSWGAIASNIAQIETQANTALEDEEEATNKLSEAVEDVLEFVEEEIEEEDE